MMTTLGKIYLLLGFVTVVPLLIFLLAIQFTPITTQHVKYELKQTNTYSQIITVFENQIDPSNSSFKAFIKKELTPTYIQQKGEKLVDDVADWMNNKTAAEPTISFEDLQQKIAPKNTNLKLQLTELSQQLQNDMPELTASLSPEQQELLKQNQNTIQTMPTTLSYSLGKQLIPIKKGYTIYKIALPVSIGVTGILLLLNLWWLTALCKTGRSKLRWIGHTFLFTSLVGILPVIYFGDISNYSLQSYMGDNKIAVMVATIMLHLLDPISQKHLEFEKIGFIGFLIAAAIIYIFSFLIPETKIVKPAADPNIVELPKTLVK